MKHIDVLLITETKLDNSFPTSQFLVKGFEELFRLDQNRNEGGVMICIRDDIPSRLLLKHVCPSHSEGLFIELNRGNVNGYSLDCTIPRPSLISTVLITLISQ